jgi:ribonuclease HII
MKVLGIDEAGKGCIIGPLVICGYMIEEGKIAELKKHGVKDSKLLTPQRRGYLYRIIKEISDDMVVLKISAEEIDKNKTFSNLNKLWFRRVNEIINTLSPNAVYVDALEANTKKCHDRIKKGLEQADQIEVICENFADKKYPVVGAASIIAKVIRDAEIKKLHERYGDFGSGYTSDERTIKFLKDWIEKNKHFPSFVRHSWVTATELRKDKIQSKIKEFIYDDEE